MRPLRLIFLVTFLDFLAFSTVIPFLPILFLDCPNCDFLADISHKMRYIILGILYAIYPIFQSITAPIWGRYSDRFGRKNVLVCSYFGNGCGYLFCILGIIYSSLIPFFIGNLIAGLTGANLATMNALISDRCKENKRKKYFGVSYMLLGLAFALGPFLCSRLLLLIPDVEILCLYLFLGCSVISFINVWIIQLFLPEAAEEQNKPALKIPLKTLFNCRKEIKLVLVSIFLLTFGWYAFVKTFQIFLIENIKLHGVEVLNIVSYYGLCLFLSQSLYVFFFYKFVKSKNFITAFALMLSFSILALFFAKTTALVFILVTLFSFAYSMLTPSLTGFFSDLSQKEGNGQMMGFHQSVVGLAKIIAPLLVSLTLIVDTSIPVLMSALSILTCGIVYLFSFFKEKKWAID